MKSIAPLWRLAQIVWYRWALREIDPLHPDVHLIVQRLNELEAA